MSQPKMICPKCGWEMNHHAVKVFPVDDSSKIDNLFDGILEEIHTCPHCGNIETRKA